MARPSAATLFNGGNLDDDLEAGLDASSDYTEERTPSRVYIQEAQPSSPVAPSLWIPLDASGNPLPPDQWQVFV